MLGEEGGGGNGGRAVTLRRAGGQAGRVQRQQLLQEGPRQAAPFAHGAGSTAPGLERGAFIVGSGNAGSGGVNVNFGMPQGFQAGTSPPAARRSTGDGRGIGGLAKSASVNEGLMAQSSEAGGRSKAPRPRMVSMRQASTSDLAGHG